MEIVVAAMFDICVNILYPLFYLHIKKQKFGEDLRFVFLSPDAGLQPESPLLVKKPAIPPK